MGDEIRHLLFIRPLRPRDRSRAADFLDMRQHVRAPIRQRRGSKGAKDPRGDRFGRQRIVTTGEPGEIRCRRGFARTAVSAASLSSASAPIARWPRFCSAACSCWRFSSPRQGAAFEHAAARRFQPGVGRWRDLSDAVKQDIACPPRRGALSRRLRAHDRTFQQQPVRILDVIARQRRQQLFLAAKTAAELAARLCSVSVKSPAHA